MRPFDRSGPTALSRYWTALVQGASADELTRLALPLDPTMLATMRRLRSLRGDLQPDSAFVDRLEATLLARQSSAATSIQDSVVPSSGNGRLAAAPPAFPITTLPPDRRWRTALAAAVLVLVLGGMAVFWAWDGRDSGNFADGPSILAPGTPLPTDETLFEITLPAEVIPQGDERVSGLSYDSYRPNSESVWRPYCCDGPLVQYQLTGSLRVRGDAPMQILRASGEIEDIPADIEATVNTGDTLITLNQTGLTSINIGTESAIVLSWLFLDSPGNRFGGRQGQDGLAGGNHRDVGDFDSTLIPMAGDLTVRLEHLRLNPERVVTVDDGEAMIPVERDPTTEDILFAEDGSFTASNLVDAPTTEIFLITFGPAEEGGSTPVP